MALTSLFPVTFPQLPHLPLTPFTLLPFLSPSLFSFPWSFLLFACPEFSFISSFLHFLCSSLPPLSVIILLHFRTLVSPFPPCSFSSLPSMFAHSPRFLPFFPCLYHLHRNCSFLTPCLTCFTCNRFLFVLYLLASRDSYILNFYSSSLVPFIHIHLPSMPFPPSSLPPDSHALHREK